MFYGSTWVGETYFHYDTADDIAASTDLTGDIGRIGSRAMIAFSLVTFVGSVVLPWVIASPEDEASWEHRIPASLAGPSKKKSILKSVDLMSAWMASHVVFGAAMILAPFVQSVTLATVLVATLGM